VRLSPSIALLRTQSDARLAALAREGSEAAFQAIVERYRRDVLRACRRILPEARAEDAVQQVFLSAWGALQRTEVHDIRPWLLRIARNTALNALRVQGYDHDELRDGLRVGEAPQAELERRDVIRQTLAGVAALPERQRDALLRQAVDGASHASIARELGLSEGATRQLLMRARTTLRAATTAVTPLPFVSWLAMAAGRGASSGGVERIAEAAAGGSAAGASALLAKAGAVAVIAGGMATPVVIHRTGDHPRVKSSALPAAVMAAPATAKAIAAHGETATGEGTSTPISAPAKQVENLSGRRARKRRAGRGGGEDRQDERRRDQSGSDGREDATRRDDEADDDPRPSTSGSGRRPRDDEDDDDHSGSGSSGSGSSGSGSSGSGRHEPESEPEPDDTPEPLETPDEKPDSSGPGSGPAPTPVPEVDPERTPEPDDDGPAPGPPAPDLDPDE
jgi:RNA polymerase sigma factor (sigma-70 family)